MKIPISENIRLIREAKGYSQEYMATKLKLTQQAYSIMEKNPENCKLLQLKEVAKILDVDLLSLIGEDNVYVMQNYYQSGGQAVTKIEVFNDMKAMRELQETLITQLKDEIAYWRKLSEKESLPKQ